MIAFDTIKPGYDVPSVRSANILIEYQGLGNIDLVFDLILHYFQRLTFELFSNFFLQNSIAK